MLAEIHLYFLDAFFKTFRVLKARPNNLVLKVWITFSSIGTSDLF